MDKPPEDFIDFDFRVNIFSLAEKDATREANLYNGDFIFNGKLNNLELEGKSD